LKSLISKERNLNFGDTLEETVLKQPDASEGPDLESFAESLGLENFTKNK